MQTITMYLRADSINAKLVDSFNQTVSSMPAITRGMRVLLILKLLDGDGNPVSGLENYASWDFVLAHDWNTSTTPQIRVTEGIIASGNEIRIPITETNTSELIASLGNSASKTLGAELAGFDSGHTDPGFLLQFDMQVRNRRGDAGTGSPEPVTDGNYSAPQIDAFLKAGFDVEYSADNTGWGTSEEDFLNCHYIRFRNAQLKGDWSPSVQLPIGPRGFRSTLAIGTVTTGAPDSQVAITNTGDEHDAVLNFVIPKGVKGDAATIRIGTVTTGAVGSDARISNSGDVHNAVFNFTIPRGEKGDKGDDAFGYIAYAEDATGRGFSLIPAQSLKYRAEIRVPSGIDNPSFSDFSDAVWIRYIGNDQTVYGDVLVTDQNTTVTQVSRIVFENATIRRGVEGEVIVNFKQADSVSNDELNNYSILNGRTLLSPWTNGGGSPFGDLGINVTIAADLPDAPVFETCSTFKG